ncbi:MAG: hypothetical protein ACFHVJ_06435 [Aestuariibacter sp.]
MKNLVISIVLVIAIFYLVGNVADWFFMFHIHDLNFVEPLIAGIVLCGVAGFLILIGFLIAVSLFGALLFGFGAVLLGALFVGVNLFWPVLLLLLLVYLISDKKRAA